MEHKKFLKMSKKVLNFVKVTTAIDYFKFSAENPEFVGIFKGIKELISKDGEIHTPFLFEDYETENEVYLSDTAQLTTDILAKDKDGKDIFQKNEKGEPTKDKIEPMKIGTILKIVWVGLVPIKGTNRTFNKMIVYRAE